VLGWTVEGLLGAPAPLQERIDRLREHVGTKVTFFRPEGTVFASSATPPPGPLDPASVARLARGEAVWLSAHSLAIAQRTDGRLVAYAVFDWLPDPFWWHEPAIFALSFLLLGIGAVQFARHVARPLERLAEVTKEFGLGDLRARASTSRSDEIGSVGRAFNEMADRIETLRRDEKELLANVSHELRTPLARIRVGIELARGGDEEGTERYLSGIAEDLDEVEQLLDDIITAARLDLRNERSNDPYPPLRLTPMALRAIVEPVVGRFRVHHSDRTVNLMIEGNPTVPIDRVMLKHAVSNLLDNAHKYSPAGQPIDITVGVAARGAVLIVRDYGHGIEADDLPHVFTAFFRADRSRQRETGGVGLGLTLVKRIVEAHGGTIDLESQKGRGTTVRIGLPVKATDEIVQA
jgi:signal transduction histidine kinase